MLGGIEDVSVGDRGLLLRGLAATSLVGVSLSTERDSGTKVGVTTLASQENK